MYGIGRHGKLRSMLAFTLTALFLGSVIVTFVNPAEAATLPQVTVNVNAATLVGTADSSFGFDLHSEYRDFKDDSILRQLSGNAGFKMVALWEYALPNVCTRWNEATMTGTFDWTNIDDLVKKIFGIGAQPIIYLSKWRAPNDPNGWKSDFPTGMAIDSKTLLPNPQSYAAYAAAWVQHFKSIGYTVKYWGIMPEAQTYIGWSPPGDSARIANFVNLFNAAYTRMHQVDPQIMVSTDCSLEKHFFSYFLNYGVGIDFLDFHKYDGWLYPQYSDAEMFTKAEEKYFVTDYTAYSIADARQAWLKKHGKSLPAILSEGNFNAAYADGADPRIPQMAGAVRTALVARMGMMNGLTYDLYYRLASSASAERQRPTRGTGFGMVDSDTNKPWYPYYVLRMLGTNLSPKDIMVQSSVDNIASFRTIAWNHNERINVLVISKSKQAYAVMIQGLKGTINYSKVDESISWTTPAIQTGQLTGSLTFNGYTVALIQGNASSNPPPPPPSKDVIVDDAAATFVGTWSSSSDVSGYYGSGYRYRWAGAGSNRATWSFNIPEAGSWEVFARWTSGSNRATNAPYTINHAGGSAVVRVNQEANGGVWYSLGVYSFNAGTAGIVLSDGANDVVIADAVRLVYVGS